MESLPDAEADWIGTVNGAERYSWAEVDLDGERIVGLETVAAGVATELVRPIVCGLFSFAHSAALVRGITRARGDFIGGILDYAKEHPLRALPIADWHDFGHVQTYFRSRRVVTSARHFNTLQVDGRTARKTSSDNGKIRAEAAWLDAVPPPLRIYCARLIDSGEDASGAAFYETEYGYLPTLSELFVFGRAGRPAWLHILLPGFPARLRRHNGRAVRRRLAPRPRAHQDTGPPGAIRRSKRLRRRGSAALPRPPDAIADADCPGRHRAPRPRLRAAHERHAWRFLRQQHPLRLPGRPHPWTATYISKPWVSKDCRFLPLIFFPQ